MVEREISSLSSLPKCFSHLTIFPKTQVLTHTIVYPPGFLCHASLPNKQMNKWKTSKLSEFNKTRRLFGVSPSFVLHVQCRSAGDFPLCSHCPYSLPRLHEKFDVAVTERKESFTGVSITPTYPLTKKWHIHFLCSDSLAKKVTEPHLILSGMKERESH